jgi:hypothetical protein
MHPGRLAYGGCHPGHPSKETEIIFEQELQLMNGIFAKTCAVAVVILASYNPLV